LAWRSEVRATSATQERTGRRRPGGSNRPSFRPGREPAAAESRIRTDSLIPRPNRGRGNKSPPRIRAPGRARPGARASPMLERNVEVCREGKQQEIGAARRCRLRAAAATTRQCQDERAHLQRRCRLTIRSKMKRSWPGEETDARQAVNRKHNARVGEVTIQTMKSTRNRPETRSKARRQAKPTQ